MVLTASEMPDITPLHTTIMILLTLQALIPLSGPVFLPEKPPDPALGECPSTDKEETALPEDSPVLSSLPPGLYISVSTIPHAGQGVFALRPVPPPTRFGPYAGVRTKEPSARARKSGLSWLLPGGEWIDASDESAANWMVKVNSWVGSGRQEPNLAVVLDEKMEIYYEVTEWIEVGEELLISYGHEYDTLLERRAKVKREEQERLGQVETRDQG